MGCPEANPDLQFCPDQYHVVKAIARICASISFVGSGGIILSWAAYPKLRNFSFHLVTCLSLADMITDISYFVGIYDADDVMCKFQGESTYHSCGSCACLLACNALAALQGAVCHPLAVPLPIPTCTFAMTAVSTASIRQCQRHQWLQQDV